MIREFRDESTFQPDTCELRDILTRLDQIHREVARAAERVQFLKLSAERANSRLSPAYHSRGYERSRVETAVLETDAVRWGVRELEKERDELLLTVRPLVESLPAGLLRAVATQRLIDGVPCGLIGKRMHYSRGYIYRVLELATQRLCAMYARR